MTKLVFTIISFQRASLEEKQDSVGDRAIFQGIMVFKNFLKLVFIKRTLVWPLKSTLFVLQRRVLVLCKWFKQGKSVGTPDVHRSELNNKLVSTIPKKYRDIKCHHVLLRLCKLFFVVHLEPSVALAFKNNWVSASSKGKTVTRWLSLQRVQIPFTVLIVGLFTLKARASMSLFGRL